MKTSDLFDASVVKPYNRWSDIKLSAETTKILASMTDNTYFPTPSPTVEVLGDAVNAYVTALVKAGTRDKNAVAAKNVRRAELIALCVQLGYSVSTTGNGNLEALTSTSLPLKKTTQKAVVLPPANLTIGEGLNTGELTVKADVSNGVKAVKFRYTQDPPTADAVWQEIVCSTSKCTVKNLESGKKYWFRVAAIGARGVVAWGETLLSPFVQ